MQACVASVGAVYHEISSLFAASIGITCAFDAFHCYSYDAVANDVPSVFVLGHVMLPVCPGHTNSSRPHQQHLEGRFSISHLVQERSRLFVVLLGVLSGLAEAGQELLGIVEGEHVHEVRMHLRRKRWRHPRRWHFER